MRWKSAVERAEMQMQAFKEQRAKEIAESSEIYEIEIRFSRSGAGHGLDVNVNVNPRRN